MLDTMAGSCPVFPVASITLPMGTGLPKAKPTIEEILKYAKPIVKKFIGQHAADSPREHKEEIEQCAYVRLIEAYDRIDAEKGWKSFVYTHSMGTVMDYLKSGRGFMEQKWSLQDKPEEENDDEAELADTDQAEIPAGAATSHRLPRMRQRVYLVSPDGEDMAIDQVLGQCGIFNQLDIEKLNIQWRLVAKLASQDDRLHAFAKWLLGFNLEEIGQVFGLSRGRVGQMIKEFIALLDDPVASESPGLRQTIYALGLCRKFGIPDRDQSEIFGIAIGHDLIPVDLESNNPFDIVSHYQMELF
jgi:RNA polymerase sigma factor (sigma-70 family)